MNIQTIQKFIKENFKILLLIIVSAMLIFFIKDILSILFLPNQSEKQIVIENKNIKASYQSDMDFIDCLNEQHKCIYKNINETNSQFIIQNCQGENYCAENHNLNN